MGLLIRLPFSSFSTRTAASFWGWGIEVLRINRLRALKKMGALLHSFHTPSGF